MYLLQLCFIFNAEGQEYFEKHDIFADFTDWKKKSGKKIS